MYKSLKAISALLSYPSAALQKAVPELKEAVAGDPLLGGSERSAIALVADDIARLDLYDAQERYVHLFDRTRALSLHLFEHVHGESRDRGQAMKRRAGISRHRSCPTSCPCSSNISPSARGPRYMKCSDRRCTS